MRTSGLWRIARWIIRGDSAPKEEERTSSSPHCATAHSTIVCGDADSNIALISGRSSWEGPAVCVDIVLLTGGGQQFVHPFARDPPAVGEAQADVLLIRA